MPDETPPPADQQQIQPIHLPAGDTLDLHTFAPRECAAVVEAYIEQAHEAGIRHLRIIHGKGIGTLRELVHAHLRSNPLVEHFRLADAGGGGWGATLVCLAAIPPKELIRSEKN